MTERSTTLDDLAQAVEQAGLSGITGDDFIALAARLNAAEASLFRALAVGGEHPAPALRAQVGDAVSNLSATAHRLNQKLQRLGDPRRAACRVTAREVGQGRASFWRLA